MQYDGEWRVPSWAIVVFVVLAFGGAWLVASPMWTSGQGLRYPLAGLLLPAMMFTPLVSAGIVLLLLARRGPRPVLTFLGVWPLRPARRTVWTTVLAYVGGLLVPFAALAVAVAFGWVTLDLRHFGAFRDALRAGGAGDLPIPVATLALLQLAQLPIGGLFNALVTVGEEIGWRGFLVPALARFGTWPALVVSGAVWGLWHAPIILLGYDFGRTDWAGVAFMVVGCVFLGVVLGWTRTWSGSVWPAVFAHAGVNAAAGVGAVVGVSGTTVSTVLVNPLGVPGWIVLTVVVIVLVASRSLGKRYPLGV
jgi:uncharacterized protein